jgi:hypothetical protein
MWHIKYTPSRVVLSDRIFLSFSSLPFVRAHMPLLCALHSGTSPNLLPSFSVLRLWKHPHPICCCMKSRNETSYLKNETDSWRWEQPKHRKSKQNSTGREKIVPLHPIRCINFKTICNTFTNFYVLKCLHKFRHTPNSNSRGIRMIHFGNATNATHFLTCILHISLSHIFLFRLIAQRTWEYRVLMKFFVMQISMFPAQLITRTLWLDQWLSLTLSKGPNNVGVSLPSLEVENRPSFRNVTFFSCLELLTMDKIQKPSDSDYHNISYPKSYHFMYFLFLTL